jgi:hypothetical protein
VKTEQRAKTGSKRRYNFVGSESSSEDRQIDGSNDESNDSIQKAAPKKIQNNRKPKATSTTRTGGRSAPTTKPPRGKKTRTKLKAKKARRDSNANKETIVLDEFSASDGETALRQVEEDERVKAGKARRGPKNTIVQFFHEPVQSIEKGTGNLRWSFTCKYCTKG